MSPSTTPPAPSTTRPTAAPAEADAATGRRRLDDDALDAILGADLAPELGESLGEAFDAQRARRLRRRAIWYFGALSLLTIGRVPLEVIEFVSGDGDARRAAGAALLAGVLALTATASLAAWVLTRRPDRRRLLRAVTATIVVFGSLDILVGTFVAPGAGPGVSPDATVGAAGLPPDAVPFAVLAGVLTTHLAACLFLPWTPRECLRPLAPLLVVFPVVMIPFGPAATGVAVAAAVVAPLAGAPGLLVCTWRHARERQRFLLAALQDEVRESRRELATARSIHESMLPEAIVDGPMRLHYAFEPVRDLGGDFLVVHRDDGPGGASDAGAITIVLLDVTGHGVAAALGATRLHGELQRTLEERPAITPGELLTAANTACRRILAPHAIFATAFAARLTPGDGTLEWASAGHLPGMILRPGGGDAIVRLPATTTMLGVLDPPRFDPGRSHARLGRGDRLILVTDGIVEARSDSGRRLEQDGTERLVRRAAGRRGGGTAEPGLLPGRLLRAVDRFSDVPAEDDRVVVELAREG